MQLLLHFCFNIKAPCAVIRFQTKTEPFENALQRRAIWKWLFRCFLVWTEKTMLSEDGDVIKTDGRKRYVNDKCERKSFWKRSKTAPFSFENGLVRTAPKKPHINTFGVFMETSSWNAAEIQIFLFSYNFYIFSSFLCNLVKQAKDMEDSCPHLKAKHSFISVQSPTSFSFMQHFKVIIASE